VMAKSTSMARNFDYPWLCESESESEIDRESRAGDGVVCERGREDNGK
jgi:hypothetical protein